MARACFLDKGEGYGFHLASEKGMQFIRTITEESPAAHAGILEGDRLLGVNDENIIGCNHAEVVELIKQSGNHVNLVVISPIPDVDLSDDHQMTLMMPRECCLTRQESGFGFVLHSERKQKITTTFYMTKIAHKGASWEGGVNDDDKIVSIDGELITSDLEHKDVVSRIKDKKQIKVVVVNRNNQLDLSLCHAIRAPAARRDISKTSKDASPDPETIPSSSTKSSDSSASEDLSSTAPPSSKEIEETFPSLDFSKMSLNDLKHSVRIAKRSCQSKDLSWKEQRSVFKDL